MINVGNEVAVTQAIATRFEQTRAAMQQHFNHTDVANTDGVRYLQQNTVTVDRLTIAAGSYVVLPSSLNTTPTVAHLDAPGGFQASTFRAHEINQHTH